MEQLKLRIICNIEEACNQITFSNQNEFIKKVKVVIVKALENEKIMGDLFNFYMHNIEIVNDQYWFTFAIEDWDNRFQTLTYKITLPNIENPYKIIESPTRFHQLLED
jgi:hypothetical protein